MADSGLTEFVSSGASPAPNFLLEDVDVDAPKGAERHGPMQKGVSSIVSHRKVQFFQWHHEDLSDSEKTVVGRLGMVQ